MGGSMTFDEKVLEAAKVYSQRGNQFVYAVSWDEVEEIFIAGARFRDELQKEINAAHSVLDEEGQPISDVKTLPSQRDEDIKKAFHAGKCEGQGTLDLLLLEVGQLSGENNRLKGLVEVARKALVFYQTCETPDDFQNKLNESKDWINCQVSYKGPSKAGKALTKIDFKGTK